MQVCNINSIVIWKNSISFGYLKKAICIISSRLQRNLPYKPRLANCHISRAKAFSKESTMNISEYILLLLFAVTFARSRAQLEGLPSLKQRNFLRVEEESNFLVSPSGTFSSGFYKVGANASCLVHQYCQ